MDNLKKYLTFWSQRPHAKLWFGVTAIIIVACVYILTNSQQTEPEPTVVNSAVPTTVPTAVPITPTPLPITRVSAKPRASKSPTATATVQTTDTPKTTVQTTATPIVVDNTAIKTIASELKSVDLSGLSSSIDGLESAVGQFNN